MLIDVAPMVNIISCQTRLRNAHEMAPAGLMGAWRVQRMSAVVVEGAVHRTSVFDKDEGEGKRGHEPCAWAISLRHKALRLGILTQDTYLLPTVIMVTSHVPPFTTLIFISSCDRITRL